jgi:hypothetical protein
MQNRAVGIVQQCCQFGGINQRPLLAGSDRTYNDCNWAQSCHSAACSKAGTLVIGHISAAYTTVSKCLPSACLNKALARIIPKFIV